MIRPVLLISTWQPDHDNGANDMCRGTYLYTWGYFFEYRFVFDRSRKLETMLPDEIRVEADSGLLNTPFKTKLAIKWAYDQGYSHVCYIPTDCYVIVPRILRSFIEHWQAGHDYWGFHSYDEHHIGGGSAYWLSHEAMEAVLAYEAHEDYEDRWVGSACREAGLVAVHDEKYRSVEQPYLKDACTVHLSQGTGNYDPATMENLHKCVISGAKYDAGGLVL